MQTNDSRMRRMMRNAAILLGVFLLGLLPPMIRSMQLKRELAALRSDLTLSETRDIASLAFLETTRNNFGKAAEHASRLYQRLEQVAQSQEEPASSIAREALAKRDGVMGLLATADAAARTELQDLTSRLLAAGETQARARNR